MLKTGSGSGDEVEAAAAAWAIISRERALSFEEQQDLDAWLAAAPRNLGAYIRAQALWTDLDRITALDRRAPPPMQVDQPPQRWRHFAMAASLAAVLVVSGVAHSRLAGRITTARDDVRQIALADGSTVTINGNTVLQVRFDGEVRRIILREGEASFKVAHDSKRPFFVVADDVDVLAVGTEFAVGMVGDDVAVTVAEGVVAVGDGDATGPRYVRSNEQFVSGETGSRKMALDPVEVERQLAWRRKLLVFRGQPLGVAAADVNRYSETRVVIDDPTLARAEFVGVFRLGDARAFADAAAYAFNGQVVERDGSLHLLRKQYSPAH